MIDLSFLKHCRLSRFDLLPPNWINLLLNGDKGLVPAITVNAYASEVTGLLRDPGCLAHLREGAKQSADHYSIENMAENFHAGILQALAEPCVS